MKKCFVLAVLAVVLFVCPAPAAKVNVRVAGRGAVSVGTVNGVFRSSFIGSRIFSPAFAGGYYGSRFIGSSFGYGSQFNSLGLGYGASFLPAFGYGASFAPAVSYAAPGCSGAAVTSYAPAVNYTAPACSGSSTIYSGGSTLSAPDRFVEGFLSGASSAGLSSRVAAIEQAQAAMEAGRRSDSAAMAAALQRIEGKLPK